MTSNIINLNKARKQKMRAKKEQRAAQNRAKYGLTKSQRFKAQAEKKKRDAELDGTVRDTADDNDLDPGSVS